MSLQFGLEALWHFSNLTDSSGNGHTLTNTNATQTTDKNAVSNQAYDFNGTNAYMSTTSLTSWLNTFDTQDKAWSYWMNLGTISTVDTICFVSDSDVNPRINLGDFAGTGGNTFRFEVRDDAGNFAGVNYIHPFGTSTWIHIAGNWDSTTKTLTMYANGVQVATATNGSVSTISQFTTAEPFTIGARNTGGTVDHYMDGKVDEFRLYNRKLTQYEVWQLYYGYDTTFNQYGILRSGLEAEYHFTGDATDSSGNSNDGTVTGATLTTDKNAVSNQAYDFSGSGQYITATNISAIDTANDFSISLWFKADQTATYALMVAHSNDSTDRIYMSVASNKIEMGIYTGSFTTLSTAFTDTTSWHHLVLTSASGTLTGFLDGVPFTTTGTAQGTDATAQLRIGTKTGTPADYWNGKIDEIKLYSREITDTEVKMLYYGYDTTATSYETITGDLDIYYDFTGDTNDESGNGNNATNYGCDLTTDKNAVSNQAYDWIKTNSDYMQAASSSSLTNAFAISIWVNSDAWSGGVPVVEIRETVLADLVGIGYGRLETAGEMELGLYDGTGWTVIEDPSPSTATWAHYLLSFDGSKVYAYRDGISLGTPETIAGTFSLTPDVIRLGRDQGTGGLYYDGKQDEFRLYTTHLTEDEAIELAYGYDTPTMVEDGPAGYSNKVLGITGYSKINGIAAANISKFNGI